MAATPEDLRERAAGIIAAAEAHEMQGRQYLARAMREDARLMTEAADQLDVPRGYRGDIPDELVTAILQETNPRVLDPSRWYHEHEREVALHRAAAPVREALCSSALRALLPKELP